MKAIFKYSFIVYLIACGFVSFAQLHNLDSLIILAQKAENDSLKITHYNRVISVLIDRGDLHRADSFLNVFIKVPVGQQEERKKSYYIHYQGYLAELRGEYSKALNYYFDALKMAEKQNDISLIASLNNNLGVIYFTQNEFDKSLNYYLNAVAILKKNGRTKGFAAYYNNIGNIYFSKKDFTQALKYYNQSLDLRKRGKDEAGVANSLNNIGSVYLEINELDKALACFDQAMGIQKKNGDKFSLAYSFINKGGVYAKKKNFTLAENNILEGLRLSKEINFPDALRDSYSALYDVYQNKQEPTNALKYYKLFISFRDSLRNEQQLKEINQREMNNKLFEKEVLLKAENEKQNIEHREKEKRDKILIYSTSLVLIIIVVFSIFLFNRFKLTENQKKVIEEKNKEVMDSINYAKRLQTAILLPEENLSKHFSEIFILFKPKDIVSGDFYWFSESEKNKIIAVADCTGHGVPGGFMSMLGYESLQEVALRENITTTSQALKSLDKKITATLNKSSRSFRDGMDIALCAFSKTNNQLQYSGANRPLIQISEGVLIEHKPDKNTIGGDIDNEDKQYSTKNIECKKGDLFYMFTDGYADQFGGEKSDGLGKKFKYKNLLTALLSIKNLPLSEQKNSLEKIFNDWKGHLEQLDDVCVIGLKI